MNYGIRPPDYRLPDSTHIGRVKLQVSDLARSIEFYQTTLGFELLASPEDRAVLGAGGVPLVELQAGARGPLGGRRLGLYHFAILLPDRPSLGSCMSHLLGLGIQPGASDHLVSEALYLQDPDDLGIEIYRDRPREEWRTNGQEIAMTTEPLDSRGVLNAATDPWQGMPAGTTIGHVHLHVGDLEEARAFYHAAVGLDVVVWSYPGALFTSAGGYHHHLGLNTWAGPRARPASADEPRLIEWELLLPSGSDIAAAVESIEKAGYSASLEEVGGSIALDPWGTALRLTV